MSDSVMVDSFANRRVSAVIATGITAFEGVVNGMRGATTRRTAGLFTRDRHSRVDRGGPYQMAGPACGYAKWNRV
jgi:hypothetical protein